jgi:hypothetical protein
VESYQFTYVSVAHSAAGLGLIGINLRREDGTPFAIVLSVDDAKRLLEDLPRQVRIADQTSN